MVRNVVSIFQIDGESSTARWQGRGLLRPRTGPRLGTVHPKARNSPVGAQVMGSWLPHHPQSVEVTACSGGLVPLSSGTGRRRRCR